VENYFREMFAKNSCLLFNTNMLINFKKLAASFRNAANGFKEVLKHEQSFRLQIVFAGVVVVLMFYFPLVALERAILILVCALVLGLELLNSQIERALDLVAPHYNYKVKAIKDISAAAVLVAVLAAMLVGFFIFLPYVVK